MQILKSRTGVILDSIIAGESIPDNIDLPLLTYTKPSTFYGEDSEEVQHLKKYNALSLYVSKQSDLRITNRTSVFEFYNALEIIIKESTDNG